MMDKLCLLRRSSISQIQKYIFPLQVDPVHQVLGTPPLKDYDGEKMHICYLPYKCFPRFWISCYSHKAKKFRIMVCIVKAELASSEWILCCVLTDICCDIQSDNDDESCQSQLAEATRTSYIEGRWVSEEENVRMACSINGACLPANGDYSAYHDWGL